MNKAATYLIEISVENARGAPFRRSSEKKKHPYYVCDHLTAPVALTAVHIELE